MYDFNSKVHIQIPKARREHTKKTDTHYQHISTVRTISYTVTQPALPYGSYAVFATVRAGGVGLRLLMAMPSPRPRSLYRSAE